MVPFLLVAFSRPNPSLGHQTIFGEHTAYEVEPYDVTRSLVSHLLCSSFLRAIPGSLLSDHRPPPISPLVFHLANAAQGVP